MWDSEVNSPEAILKFDAELAKFTATKGSWDDDVEFLAQQFGVVPCTFLSKIEMEDKLRIIRIANAALDISSWRVFLMALSVASSVEEICLHHCSITAQHLQDLSLVLNKLGNFAVIKLEYIDYPVEERDAFFESLKVILGSPCNIDMISLKGIDIGDETMLTLTPLIENNCTFQALNLSQTGITDESVLPLMNVLRLHTTIKSVSLARNNISATVLSAFLDVIGGSEATVEDEKFFKKQLKAIDDKNKKTKAANKNRKKANLPDLPEIGPVLDRIHQVGSHQMVINRALSMVDFSWCPDITSAAVLDFIKGLAQKNAASASGPPAMPNAKGGKASPGTEKRPGSSGGKGKGKTPPGSAGDAGRQSAVDFDFAKLEILFRGMFTSENKEDINRTVAQLSITTTKFIT